MAITDELRAWAHGPDEGDDWLDRIDEFCDRIDAEHEADVSTACRLAAGLDDDALAKLLYWMGYADAMRKAVSVINHDFDRAGDE